MKTITSTKLSKTMSKFSYKSVESPSQSPQKHKEDVDVTQTRIYKVLKAFRLQQYAKVSLSLSVGHCWFRVW